jgi:hypothetical protein
MKGAIVSRDSCFADCLTLPGGEDRTTNAGG